MIQNHFVEVYLRGASTPVVVAQASENVAIGTLVFVANHLKKPPSRRSFAWVVSMKGEVAEMNEDGVENRDVNVPIAVFDLREVVGARWVTTSSGGVDG